MLTEYWNVEFPSEQFVLRGKFRNPSDVGPRPVVILAHGLGGLKEWSNIPVVADALFDAGIATLSFDYRNFGDSDGFPRDETDIAGQVEDFRSAVTFVSARADVDAQNIGIWGTSMGGRIVLEAAAMDHRIRCVVSQVTGAVVTPEMLAFMSGFNGDVDALERALEDDRLARAAGVEAKYVAMKMGDDPKAEFAEHWNAMGPLERRNSHERITLQSFDPKAYRDLKTVVPDISAPLGFVLTDHDFAIPLKYAAELFELANEPKSMAVVPGHHYSLYTKHKDWAAKVACDWFVTHLKS